ncbi:ChrR family anti-sigma-E factor [Aeromonas cavernicola]|uniref:Transcriptional regulator n=1 Tax=Aeromonas cavernicola TaxID=1006623 RepID=A0A2H9U474_9GAMM|nr:ChrR family anti-sigma-E factor [Aeromonas cavernicola]PJG58811.1 transcriptional regulator [Aeromonas cavernicola]
MIKAHPTDPMLRAFAADQLALPLAVGLAAHCEFCPACATRLKGFEEELANQYLADDVTAPPRTSVAQAELAPEFEALLAAIVAQPQPEPTTTLRQASEIQVAGRAYPLPRVLARYRSPKWRHIGAIRQQSLPLDEMGARASLLYIDAGGRIPEHTHQGYELTLLLAGSIDDGDTRYQAGDFIWRDASHAHSPHTPDGCLCYTVQDAPVQFTKGLSRLLNGISQHLY